MSWDVADWDALWKAAMNDTRNIGSEKWDSMAPVFRRWMLPAIGRQGFK